MTEISKQISIIGSTKNIVQMWLSMGNKEHHLHTVWFALPLTLTNKSKCNSLAIGH